MKFMIILHLYRWNFWETLIAWRNINPATTLNTVKRTDGYRCSIMNMIFLFLLDVSIFIRIKQAGQSNLHVSTQNLKLFLRLNLKIIIHHKRAPTQRLNYNIKIRYVHNTIQYQRLNLRPLGKRVASYKCCLSKTYISITMKNNKWK